MDNFSSLAKIIGAIAVIRMSIDSFNSYVQLAVSMVNVWILKGNSCKTSKGHGQAYGFLMLVTYNTQHVFCYCLDNAETFLLQQT